MRVGIFGIALSFMISVLGTGAAFACPPGTIFSAYNGSGICVRPGEGKNIAIRCAAAGSVAICPAGYDLSRKASDPNHAYCCPQVMPTSLPSCETQCGPLLTAVTPQAEANRVYNNCMAMCAGNDNGVIVCADGTHFRVGQHDKHC